MCESSFKQTRVDYKEYLSLKMFMWTARMPRRDTSKGQNFFEKGQKAYKRFKLYE